MLRRQSMDGEEMMSDEPFCCPTVTVEDIAWASELLELPPQAFTGPDGTDPRIGVLISMDPMDVAACPGSGKTTLLVAKLAILARKWEDRTRGISVLSHTNAAHREIEARLGSSSAGNRLLSYPHFIGTIHAFIDEFLAVPWLRSLGWPVKLIDTEICERRRWSKIEFRLRRGLGNRRICQSDLKLAAPNFSVALKRGPFPLAKTTETYISVCRVFRDVALEGYHCYDDMFLWANDLLDQMPGMVLVLRDRFPLLFVDEAQDNSETQSAMLIRAFTEGGSPSIRQRFGDPNQAIYDFLGGQEAITDRFPDDAPKVTVPNSHRFGQGIADVADPLGLEPYSLAGLGPAFDLASGETEGQHTVFVFDEPGVGKVLEAYGGLLLDTFTDEEIDGGVFTALGQVHRDTGDDHVPRHVGHYWPDYDAALTRSDPKPPTFVQYVTVAQGKASISGECHSAADSIAEGILRLAGMGTGGSHLRPSRYRHRQVMRLLENDTDARQSYIELVAQYAVNAVALTRAAWEDSTGADVRAIAEAVAGTADSRVSGGCIPCLGRWIRGGCGQDRQDGAGNEHLSVCEGRQEGRHTRWVHSLGQGRDPHGHACPGYVLVFSQPQRPSAVVERIVSRWYRSRRPPAD